MVEISTFQQIAVRCVTTYIDYRVVLNLNYFLAQPYYNKKNFICKGFIIFSTTLVEQKNSSMATVSLFAFIVHYLNIAVKGVCVNRESKLEIIDESATASNNFSRKFI